MIRNCVTIEAGTELWIASDFHWGHDREFIWGARGFSCSREHDDFLLGNLKENIGEFLKASLDRKLVILHLGDLSLSDPLGDKARQFFDLGNERVSTLTIPGNHASSLEALAGGAYEPRILPDQGVVTVEYEPTRQRYS